MTTAKKILFYTTFYRGTEWPNFGEGHQPFLDAKCPVSNCYLTYDKQLLGSVAKFDALLFNLWFSNIWQHWDNNKGGDK